MFTKEWWEYRLERAVLHKMDAIKEQDFMLSTKYWNQQKFIEKRIEHYKRPNKQRS
ncbi:MAG: hypothetical protein RIE52_11985 [Balneola sp.]